MTPIDDFIQLESSLLTIRFKKWGNGEEPVIALHGWLDNSASFDPLAKYLDKKITFYALDLPGHGHSEHLPAAADYTMLGGVHHILEFAKAMGFSSFHLVGHSMGAGIASLIAGVIPQRIKSLTLIDGLGPISTVKEDFPESVLNNFKIKFRKLITEKPIYQNKEEAALDRHRKSGLPIEASRILTVRGTEKNSSGKLTWKTDTRLLVPTSHPLTEEEVCVFIKKIDTKNSLIVGSNSYLRNHLGFEKRTKYLKNNKKTILEGGHHVHMERPEETASIINKTVFN